MEINELIKALAKAQGEFDEPKRNKQAYNYSYAPMDEVVRAVRDTLTKYGLFVYQHPIHSDNSIGVTTILAHESGQYIEKEFIVPYEKINPQMAGSAITYYRRYALMAVLGLAPEDDDGDAAMPKYKANPRPTKEQVAQKARENLLHTVRKKYQERTKLDGDSWHQEFLEEFKLKDIKDVSQANTEVLGNMKIWLADE